MATTKADHPIDHPTFSVNSAGHQAALFNELIDYLYSCLEAHREGWLPETTCCDDMKQARYSLDPVQSEFARDSLRGISKVCMATISPQMHRIAAITLEVFDVMSQELPGKHGLNEEVQDLVEKLEVLREVVKGYEMRAQAWRVEGTEDLVSSS